MVTDSHVRMLMRLVNQERLLKTAVTKAGMSEETARKYRKSGKGASQPRMYVVLFPEFHFFSAGLIHLRSGTAASKADAHRLSSPYLSNT